MRATRLSLMVLLVVLAFVLWNAAWVTDRCGEWTAALDEAEAALAGEGRVLVRKSGTESVIRVLAEAPDQSAADAAMKRIASALEAL